MSPRDVHHHKADGKRYRTHRYSLCNPDLDKWAYAEPRRHHIQSLSTQSASGRGDHPMSGPAPRYTYSVQEEERTHANQWIILSFPASMKTNGGSKIVTHHPSLAFFSEGFLLLRFRIRGLCILFPCPPQRVRPLPFIGSGLTLARILVASGGVGLRWRWLSATYCRCLTLGRGPS